MAQKQPACYLQSGIVGSTSELLLVHNFLRVFYLSVQILSFLHPLTFRTLLLITLFQSLVNPITAASTQFKCYFCGLNSHPLSSCHARELKYHKCGKEENFSEVCQSVSFPRSAARATLATNIVSITSPKCFSKAILKIEISRVTINALIDKVSSMLELQK